VKIRLLVPAYNGCAKLAGQRPPAGSRSLHHFQLLHPAARPKLGRERGENMKHLVVLGVAALVLVACDDKPGIQGMEATAQGVYYKTLMGRLYRVEGDKLVLISEPAKVDPRSLAFSMVIPASETGTGFPAKVEGSLRLQGDAAKIRLQLSLAPVGQKQPSVEDQDRFISDLGDGSGRLKAVILSFTDKDGYVAASQRTAPTGSGWTSITDDNGRLNSAVWNTREEIDPMQAAEIATVVVGWSSTAPPQAPPVLPTPTPAPAAMTAPDGTAPDPYGQ
jgi:hypothetical protein